MLTEIGYETPGESITGGIESVKNLLSEFGKDLQIIEKQRDDHEYFYQEDFNKFLLE